MKKIRVLGLGGAGLKMAAGLKSGWPQSGWEYWGADSDESALDNADLDRKWSIGAKMSRGLGAGGDPEIAREWIEDISANLLESFEGVDWLFLLVGLGGGIGSGTSARIARLATSQGCFVMALCAMPFACEGPRRNQQARDGLRELSLAADGLIPFSNQELLDVLGEDISMKHAMEHGLERIHEAIQGLVGLQKRPGMIELDLADIRAVAHGCAAFRCLHTHTVEGEDRRAQLLAEIQTSPWLKSIQDWGQVDAVLASVEGGESIKMREIDGIMEGLRARAPEAKIYLGAHMRNDWGEKTRLTLLINGGADQPWNVFEKRTQTSSVAVESSEVEIVASSPVSSAWTQQAMSGMEALPEWGPEAQPGLFESPLFNDDSGSSQFGNSQMTGYNQPALPMDIPRMDRFKESEPTLRMGEDLDIPTFIRRRKLTDPK